MGHQFHIVLGSGDTHDVDFTAASMVIVRTRKTNDFGVIEDVEQAFSDVADITVVEVDDPKIPEPNIIQESPYLGTPETAAQAAREMPIGDGARLVEQGLEKFPGDENLLAAQAEIHGKLQASGVAANDAAAAATAAPVADVATTEPTVDVPLTDPFASPDAAPAAEQTDVATTEPTVEATTETVTPDPPEAVSSDTSATSSSTDSTSSDTTATTETAPDTTDTPAA